MPPETAPTSSSSATPGGAGPYLFVGESLALDLVNTEVVVRGKPRDLLDGPGGFASWWDEARGRYPEVGWPAASLARRDDPSVLPAAKRLRATLRRLFGAVADGAAVDDRDLAALNGTLADGRERIETREGGGLRAVWRPSEDGPSTVLLPIARSARDLLVDVDPGRLHRCANERCVLLFRDTTKSATRRWCSTGCMDRARSAERHRARRAASAR